MPPLLLPTFEERLPQIRLAIAKRKRKWTLAAVPFEDAFAQVLAHVYLKYHTFDSAKGEFSHWLSRVITRKLINIIRDCHGRWSRPCIKSCPFNTGDDNCSKTSTGKQNGECLAFRLWEKRKKSEFEIKQPLPLENHMQEVYNVMDTSFDTEGAKEIKEVIDSRICEKLTERDCSIYRALFIEGVTGAEVATRLGFVTKPGARVHGGYLIILAARKRIALAAKEIARDRELA